MHTKKEYTLSTHLNEEQIERVAGSLFGKDPAEQTEMAKSQGMVPNEQGLIEFNRPIGFELDELQIQPPFASCIGKYTE